MSHALAVGGILCLGLFLHQFLAGTGIGLAYVPRLPLLCNYLTGNHRGFPTTSRANLLAQNILRAEIKQGLNSSVAVYSADNCMLFYEPFSRNVTLIVLEWNSDAR